MEVARLMVFSDLTSVTSPRRLSCSRLVRKASENWSRATRGFSFFPPGVPNTRLISGASLAQDGIGLPGSFRLRASNVRIFPFRLDPGIMGSPLKASRMTGLSSAPMAEKPLEPPMCSPVRTFN